MVQSIIRREIIQQSESNKEIREIMKYLVIGFMVAAVIGAIVGILLTIAEER